MSGRFGTVSVHPHLHRRLMFTFGLLAVYRVGCLIPSPGINPEVMLQFMQATEEGAVLGILNTFTGNSLERVAVFALGIVPYITASTLFQLLTVIVPHLEQLSRTALGRRKLTQYTRFATLVISVIQSSALAIFLEQLTTSQGSAMVPTPGWGFRAMTVLTLTAGCASVMWLSEQITLHGVGNGMSLIIYCGLLVGVRQPVLDTIESLRTGTLSLMAATLLGVFMVLVVALVVFMELASRRIPVQYAKRVVGRKVYGGQATYLPLRINTGGVVPVIFASSVVVIPGAIAGMFKTEWLQWIASVLAWGQPLHYLIYVAAIVFFCYFYVSIIFNPADQAGKLRRFGGYIPGVQSARGTAEYIDWILTRLTLVGAFYLAAVTVLPEFLLNGVQVDGLPLIGATLDANLPGWVTHGTGINFSFGGPTLIIVVGLATGFIRDIQSHMFLPYDESLKRDRLRGRRG